MGHFITGIRDLSLNFLQAIRIFRIFRLFKAEKYLRAGSILWRVVKNNREVLLTTFMLGVILFICTSTALYYTQRNAHKPYIRYDSIPDAMYSAILMLTSIEVPDDAQCTLDYFSFSSH